MAMRYASTSTRRILPSPLAVIKFIIRTQQYKSLENSFLHYPRVDDVLIRASNLQGRWCSRRLPTHRAGLSPSSAPAALLHVSLLPVPTSPASATNQSSALRCPRGESSH